MTKPRDHFLPRLQSIVDQFGDRSAVVEDGETTYTYSQLWNAAGDIASWLQSNDVTPNSIVAISLEKSAAWIAAMLGVWRCGAAWVPIEPNLPQDRQPSLSGPDAGSTDQRHWDERVFAQPVFAVDFV